MGMVYTSEQRERIARDVGRLKRGELLLTQAVALVGSREAQADELAKLAGESEGFSASDPLTAASSALRAGEPAVIASVLMQVANSRGNLESLFAFEPAETGIVDKLLLGPVGDAIVVAGVAGRALVGAEIPEATSGREAANVAKGQTIAERIKLGLGVSGVVLVLLVVGYLVLVRGK